MAREGGYEPLAERLFTELRCQRLLLEYDSERAGGFEPLRFVPANKIVVLGLISSKTGPLESVTMCLRGLTRPRSTCPSSASR